MSNSVHVPENQAAQTHTRTPHNLAPPHAMTSTRDQDRYRKGSHPSPTRSTSEIMEVLFSRRLFLILNALSMYFITISTTCSVRPGSPCPISAFSSCCLPPITGFMLYFTLSKSLYKSCRTLSYHILIQSAFRLLLGLSNIHHILSPLLFSFPTALSICSGC